MFETPFTGCLQASPPELPIERHEDGVRRALNRLKEYDRDYGYVIDKQQRFYGVVSVESLSAQLKHDDPRLSNAYLPDIPTLDRDKPLNELIGDVAAAPCGLPVIDAERRYLGVVTKASLLQTLDREGG